MSRLIQFSGATLALLAVLGTAACSTEATPKPSQSSQENSAAGMPEFSGPFASLLAQIWQESDSDYVRQVVQDGVVSDQEWAETSARLERCLTDKNIKFLGFREDGAYGYKGNGSNDQTQEVLSRCEKESGETWINMLRLAQTNNPNNEPPEVAVRECMIRLGVVDKSYSSKDFLKDVENLAFPLKKGGPGIDGFWTCNANPSAKTVTTDNDSPSGNE